MSPAGSDGRSSKAGRGPQEDGDGKPAAEHDRLRARATRLPPGSFGALQLRPGRGGSLGRRGSRPAGHALGGPGRRGAPAQLRLLPRRVEPLRQRPPRARHQEGRRRARHHAAPARVARHPARAHQARGRPHARDHAAHGEGHRLPCEERQREAGDHHPRERRDRRASPRPVPDARAPPARGRHPRGLGELRRDHGGGPLPDRAREDAERRPPDGLLHLGHDGRAQDGAPHASVLRPRPPAHGKVLARPLGQRSALEPLRHRLGQGGLQQPLRPLAHGRRPPDRGRSGKVRRQALPHPPRAARGDHLLRASHRLSHDGAGGPPPLPAAEAPPLRRRRRAAQP